MKRGGKRPGAGRKKGQATIAAEKAREILIMKITAEIEPLAKALIAKAKRGDVAAIKELFDRAFGKSSQPLSATDPETGKAIPIAVINVVPIETSKIKS